MKKLVLVLLLGISTAAIAQTSKTYIERYKDAAIKAMQVHGVPASIILGIAMHESGNGTSKIARYLNNHFGIKGRNNSTDIKSSYKGYSSVEECYADFIRILEKRSRFDFLFEHTTPYDYRTWVLAIQKGGYAASPSWGSKVLATIQKFKLYEFDEPQPNKEKQTASNSDIPASLLAPEPKNNSDAKEADIIYKVKKGDNLRAIAEKYNTSVKYIQKRNNLKGSLLQPGQKLKL